MLVIQNQAHNLDIPKSKQIAPPPKAVKSRLKMLVI